LKVKGEGAAQHQKEGLIWVCSWRGAVYQNSCFLRASFIFYHNKNKKKFRAGFGTSKHPLDMVSSEGVL
jgi:hypothetical protein